MSAPSVGAERPAERQLDVAALLGWVVLLKFRIAVEVVEKPDRSRNGRFGSAASAGNRSAPRMDSLPRRVSSVAP
jgi:hypothetical protein